MWTGLQRPNFGLFDLYVSIILGWWRYFWVFICVSFWWLKFDEYRVIVKSPSYRSRCLGIVPTGIYFSFFLLVILHPRITTYRRPTYNYAPEERIESIVYVTVDYYRSATTDAVIYINICGHAELKIKMTDSICRMSSSPATDIVQHFYNLFENVNNWV